MITHLKVFYSFRMDNCTSCLNINRSLSLKSISKRILAQQSSIVLISEPQSEFVEKLKALYLPLRSVVNYSIWFIELNF